MPRTMSTTMAAYFLFAAWPALAQTTAGGGGTGTAGGLADWWWVILVVVAIGAAIWYFTSRKDRV